MCVSSHGLPWPFRPALWSFRRYLMCLHGIKQYYKGWYALRRISAGGSWFSMTLQIWTQPDSRYLFLDSAEQTAEFRIILRFSLYNINRSFRFFFSRLKKFQTDPAISPVSVCVLDSRKWSGCCLFSWWLCISRRSVLRMILLSSWISFLPFPFLRVA